MKYDFCDVTFYTKMPPHPAVNSSSTVLLRQPYAKVTVASRREPLPQFKAGLANFKSSSLGYIFELKYNARYKTAFIRNRVIMNVTRDKQAWQHMKTACRSSEPLNMQKKSLATRKRSFGRSVLGRNCTCAVSNRLMEDLSDESNSDIIMAPAKSFFPEALKLMHRG